MKLKGIKEGGYVYVGFDITPEVEEWLYKSWEEWKCSYIKKTGKE